MGLSHYQFNNIYITLHIIDDVNDTDIMKLPHYLQIPSLLFTKNICYQLDRQSCCTNSVSLLKMPG